MQTFNIEILNPKAKRLLMELEALNLISIRKADASPFLAVVKRMRAKQADISLEEITKEVEKVRAKRHGKKA